MGSTLTLTNAVTSDAGGVWECSPITLQAMAQTKIINVRMTLD